MTPELVEAIKHIFDSCHNPIVLEIGAADGADTTDLYTLARSAGDPNFHAFEPDPRNTAEFRKKRHLNSIVLNECAVSDHNGTALMYFSDGKHPNSPGSWSFSNTLKEPTGHYQRYNWVSFRDPIPVGTVTLDSYYRAQLAHEVIDFIWADVNGAEREMINGGLGTLGRTRFMLTEFRSGPELFKGQATMWDLARLLPDWEPEIVLQDNVLLKNMAYQSGGKFFGRKSFDDFSAAWDGDSR